MSSSRDAATDLAPRSIASSSNAAEGVIQSDNALSLHFGGKLLSPRIAWRIDGEASAPVVIALGGISAGRRVADNGEGVKGWWAEVVGRGRALDLTRWRVLGIDYLGGSGDSTGPSRGQTNFPATSAYDQAEAIRRVLHHLGIAHVRAVIGASYGGMVALAIAERFPELLERAVVISAADRTHPMSTAWRSVQRAMVRYAAKYGDAAEGLRLARALAMATYRTPQEFAQRFAGPAACVDGRFVFPVESYLLARGDAYAATYIPEAFVCLSESIDLHEVDATQIRLPVTLVAVGEDQLVPLSDMKALHERLRGPKELVEITSLYGHDAFLKEGRILAEIFARALA